MTKRLPEGLRRSVGRWFYHTFREEHLYHKGLHVATMWKQDNGRYTWHLWDKNGVGGENDTDPDRHTAVMSVEAALARAARGAKP